MAALRVELRGLRPGGFPPSEVEFLKSGISGNAPGIRLPERDGASR